MAYPKEVVEFAKKKYLRVGPDGEHQYTSSEIAKLIHKEFTGCEKVDSSTIRRWALNKDKVTKKSWADLWETGQRHGVEKAIEDAERLIEADEHIELQVDAIIRQRAERAIKLGELITTKLKKGKALENIDLKTLQTSELIFNNLNLEGQQKESEKLEIDYNYLDEVVDNE